MPGNRLLLDTNVLLTATSPARAGYAQAHRVLNEWPDHGRRLLVSGQILREYLVVATRPVERNGLGLTVPASLENVAALTRRVGVVDETQAVSDALRQLLKDVPCQGKQIHDANVVATALVHSIPAILTQNLADFRRFEPSVALVPLTG